MPATERSVAPDLSGQLHPCSRGVFLMGVPRGDKTTTCRLQAGPLGIEAAGSSHEKEKNELQLGMAIEWGTRPASAKKM